MPEKELINPKKIGILLGAVALDGIVSLIGLVSISKDPTNIWILGLSKTRFALAAAIALFSLVFIVLALKSRLDKGWSRKIIHRGLDAFNSTRLAAFIFAFALLGIGAGIFTSFALIFSANAFERVYLIRLAPLIFLETMIAVKLLLLLAKHSSGWRTVEQNLCSRIEKSSTQGSSFRVGDAGWKNIISLSSVVLLIAIVFGVRNKMGTFIIDDAWITFRYAKNLASGQGLSWEAAAPTPTEGYSNLLEVLYTAAAIRADVSPVLVARTIGTLSTITILAVVFVQLIAVTGNLWIALIPLTLYALHPFTAIHTWAGLETQLFVALNVLILFVFWRSLADEQSTANEKSPLVSLVTTLPRPLVTTLPRGNADHNAPRYWTGDAERLDKRSNAERRNEENEESERLPHKTYSGSVIFITLLALLVTLTRTEGVIVGASAMALGVFFHWKCGRKPWLWACLSYLSIFAAYTAWRWLYFGSLLTGPTLVKLSQNMLPGNIASMEFVLDCWDYLRTSPLGMYTLILFPIGLYLVCNRKSYKTKSSPAIAAQAVLAIAIIQLLCLNLVYARTNMIQNFGSRFFVQTAAQQLVIVALIGAWLYRGWLDFVLKPVAKHIPRAFLFILLIGAFGLLTIRWAGSAGALTRSYAKFIQEYNQQQSSARAIADVFNQHQKELQDQWLVTVVDSGILPYYAGMNVLGGDGLTDTNLSRFVPPTGEKAAPYSSYIYSHTPAIFVIEIYAGHLDAHHQALVCDPEFRYYNFVGGLQRKQGNTYNIYLRENLPAYDTIADQLMNLSDPQQRWHVSDQNPKATCPY